MSQPHPSPAAEQPVLAPGGRATLWCAPRGLTGLQLRTALGNTLPAGLRAAVLAPVVVLSAVGVGAAEAADEPAWLPVALIAALSAGTALQWWALRHKRRAYGMVLLTPLQFDLVLALDQLPAATVDAGRQLHDRLVWLLQQPTPDPVAVRQCELWMWQLVTSRQR